MFCPYCGASLEDDEVFCANCGSKVFRRESPSTASSMSSTGKKPSFSPGKPSSLSYSPHQGVPPPAYHVTPSTAPTYTASRKEPWLAALLSLLFPGLGQIYAGKTERGILIIVLFFVLPLFVFVFFIPMLVLVGPVGGGGIGMFFLIFFLAGIVFVIIYVWNIVDAYNLAERYNTFLTQHGRSPSNLDRW